MDAGILITVPVLCRAADTRGGHQLGLILDQFCEQSGLSASLVFLHDTPDAVKPCLPVPLKVRGSSHVSAPLPPLCSVNRSCRKGFRPCYNQRCVANSRFCDGMDDCGDNSDEAYCSSECQQPFDPPHLPQPRGRDSAAANRNVNAVCWTTCGAEPLLSNEHPHHKIKSSEISKTPPGLKM